MTRLVSCALLAVLAVAGWNRPALAQVPGGGGEAVCQVIVGGIVATQTGGVFPVGPAACGLDAIDASIAIQPSVQLAGEADAASIDPADRSGATAIVALQYDFTVTGGSAGDLVPVLVQTSGFTDVTASDDPNNSNVASASIALFGISGVGGAIINNGPGDSACSASPSNGADCFAELDSVLPLDLTSGSAERVFLQIIVSASSTSGGTASASIDPYIFVDPQFANAGDYAITVSGGVANVPPVPEPSAWTLSLAGVGGLGAVRSRRRRQVAGSTDTASFIQNSGRTSTEPCAAVGSCAASSRASARSLHSSR
jgi:MYXO-CTERM domain-containing protein